MRFFLAIVLLSLFSCGEKTVPGGDTADKPDFEESRPYVWEKRDNAWDISINPDYTFPASTQWSLVVYYSWTGIDAALPLELDINSGALFDFYPKTKESFPDGGFNEPFLAFHSEQWGSLPKKITITPGESLEILDTKIDFRSNSVSLPLAADTGTMLHYPPSCWRNSDYEIFTHNLYPGLLYLISKSFETQSRFLKRIAFFTEKAGFTGRLAADKEIAGLRDWFAHDYRSRDLAAFFDLARKENFPLNDSEILLRDLLLAQGIIKNDEGRYAEGEGALLGFSVESGNRLPVYYVHETVHGLEFIKPELQKVFLDFFESLSSSEKNFMRDALIYRGYNVLEDRQLLASETAAYLLQQKPEETDKYFREYILLWFTAYHKKVLDAEDAKEHYSAGIMQFLRDNSGIFGRRSAALQKEFQALTGLRAEGFYDLLPKNNNL